MELKKYKLGDIAKIEISGVDKKSVDGETPVRLCNFVDVYRNWAITQKLSENFMIASAKETEIVKCSIHKGQVAITKDSETRDDIGIPAYIADDFDNVLLGYHCALITPNDDVLDGKYLNAFMHTRYIQKYFENNASGSGQRYTLSNETIFQIPILLPSLEVQKAIGNLLSNIDRKIELNHQINDNLEKMAKQLYDYWFVQFNFPDENGRPYKSSGGKMSYNKRLKREIPIDWQVKNLIDFTEIKNGATPSTADEANYGGDIVWITPKDLSDQQSKFVYQGERNITKQGFDSCSTSMLPINSVLMSSRAPIGLVSIAKNDVCTNQGFKSFIPKKMEDSIYLYYYIKHHIKQIEQLGSGTTFKEVSRDDLCKFPILVVGAKESYRQWAELQNGIADKQFVLQKEIAILTKQRDELLPLLMNGQASVNYHLAHSLATFSILYRHKPKDIENEKNSYTHRCGWNGNHFIQKAA